MNTKIFFTLMLVLIGTTACVEWKPVSIPNSDMSLERQRRSEQRTEEANDVAAQEKKKAEAEQDTAH